jgi:hypothetical protein
MLVSMLVLLLLLVVGGGVGDDVGVLAVFCTA